jgi:hypothetical protein
MEVSLNSNVKSQGAHWNGACMIKQVKRTPSPYGESNFCHSTYTELPLCSLVEMQGISNKIFQNTNRSIGLEIYATEM